MGQIILFFLVILAILFANKWVPIGLTALLGAFIALICGYINISEIHEMLLLVANPTVTLILIVMISLILEKNGFFDFFAVKLIKLSKGNTKALFILIILFGAILASFFTNDGAILILTPIVISKLSYISLKEKAVVAFVMAAGFIADSSSLTFVISNLTNILSVEFYPMTFNAFFSHMLLVNIVSVIISMLMLLLVFKKDLPKRVELNKSITAMGVVKDKKLFYISLVVIPLLFITFFVFGSFYIPSSLVILPFAVILIGITLFDKKIHFMEILNNTPFNVILFSLGMYVLIYAIKNTVIFSFSVEFMMYVKSLSFQLFLFVNGLYVAFLSCVFNNLPAFLFSLFYIDALDMTESAKTLSSLSSIIGANIGQKITPIGSLATLLWFGILKKHKIHISWKYYIKISAILTLPTLVGTLLFFLMF